MVGEFLNTVRSIGQQCIDDDTFEEGSHTVPSEPYFQDTAYKMPASKEFIVIDRKNRCLATESRSVIGKMKFLLKELSLQWTIMENVILNLKVVMMQTH